MNILEYISHRIYINDHRASHSFSVYSLIALYNMLFMEPLKSVTFLELLKKSVLKYFVQQLLFILKAYPFFLDK